MSADWPVLHAWDANLPADGATLLADLSPNQQADLDAWITAHYPAWHPKGCRCRSRSRQLCPQLFGRAEVILADCPALRLWPFREDWETCSFEDFDHDPYGPPIVIPLHSPVPTSLAGDAP